MNEDHGDLTRPVGFESRQLSVGAIEETAIEKALGLAFPYFRIGEAQRERLARILL